MIIDPINRIEWRDASRLQANDYNPNVVMNDELKLLERSILQQGWIQPILINSDGIVIDGFHRAMLAQQSEAIRARYQGTCPCVVLDINRPEAMLLTIRINRAKGTHVAFRMASIVKELIDTHHFDPQEIANNIGAHLDEIELLYKDGVFEARDIKNYRFSQAWYPAESRA